MRTTSGGPSSGAARRHLTRRDAGSGPMIRHFGLLLLAAGALQSLTASLVSAQSPPAQPAPTQFQLDDKPMRVAIVRHAQPGCEPNCPEWIAATGRIDATTPGAFRRALARMGKRKLPVLIDSRGGSVDDALAVGRMIRARGLDVAVTKTVLAPCTPADTACRKLQAAGTLLGRPEARVTICASSCAFILAGGIKRYVGPWTVVGLHEIKSTATMRHFQRLYRVERRYSWGSPVEVRRTLIREKTLSTQTIEMATGEKTYEKIRKFFAEMGVADGIMPILRSAPNSSIRWMRPNELRTTALATDLINGEQLLAIAPPPAQPAPPVATLQPVQPVEAAAATPPAAPASAPVSPAPSIPAPIATTPIAAAPLATLPNAAAPNATSPKAAVEQAARPKVAAALPARPANAPDTAPTATPPVVKPAVPAKSAAKPRPRPAAASPSSTEDRRLPLGFQ